METMTPQFSFQDGELTISTPTRSFRIRGWPVPQALERLGDSLWKNWRPEFRLVKPPPEAATPALEVITPDEEDCGPDAVARRNAHNQKRVAFEAFRSQLPEGVGHHIQRFHSHQWNMLDLLSKEEAARDLAASNPVLFWCLANNDQFRRLQGLASPAEYARPYILKKQREILGWLDYPASESAVKVLRKILPEAITTLDAQMLRRALKEPLAARFLTQLRPINSGVLGLVCNPKLLSAVTPQLLAEVAIADAETIRQPTADLLIDALYLMAVLQIRLPVPRFHSIDAVREFHNLVMAESRRKSEAGNRRSLTRAKQKKVLKPQGLPSPPIPGTADIIPLTTKEALRAEGKEQNNCVGSYARRVRAGNTYLYKVLKPERATLSIAMGSDGFWRRAELESAGNRPVSPLTRAKVDEWLSAHSLSI